MFGEDHNGDVCNEGVNAGKPALVFPRLELDVLQQASSNPFDINFFGICAKSCPFEGDFVCTNEAEADVSIAMAVKAQSRDQVITDCVNNPLAQFEATIGATSCANVTIANGCFDTLFNTTSFLFRCFPSFTYQADIIGKYCYSLSTERSICAIFYTFRVSCWSLMFVVTYRSGDGMFGSENGHYSWCSNDGMPQVP